MVLICSVSLSCKCSLYKLSSPESSDLCCIDILFYFLMPEVCVYPLDVDHTKYNFVWLKSLPQSHKYLLAIHKLQKWNYFSDVLSLVPFKSPHLPVMYCFLSEEPLGVMAGLHYPVKQCKCFTCVEISTEKVVPKHDKHL